MESMWCSSSLFLVCGLICFLMGVMVGSSSRLGCHVGPPPTPNSRLFFHPPMLHRRPPSKLKPCMLLVFIAAAVVIASSRRTDPSYRRERVVGAGKERRCFPEGSNLGRRGKRERSAPEKKPSEKVAKERCEGERWQTVEELDGAAVEDPDAGVDHKNSPVDVELPESRFVGVRERIPTMVELNGMAETLAAETFGFLSEQSNLAAAAAVEEQRHDKRSEKVRNYAEQIREKELILEELNRRTEELIKQMRWVSSDRRMPAEEAEINVVEAPVSQVPSVPPKDPIEEEEEEGEEGEEGEGEGEGEELMGELELNRRTEALITKMNHHWKTENRKFG